MKIFIAYKFSGEGNKDTLKLTLGKISNALESSKHKTFIHLRDIENWEEKGLSSKDIISRALNELKKCDAILALVMSPEKSEGLLLEVGFAKALNKKIFLAVKKNANTIFLREIADDIFEFDDIEEITDEIKKI
jgi:nucleoside 2-deoxyribosyltransferase